jgi:3-hydroxyacyl-[acyl-carrier-protein] dehydratase
VLEHAAIRALLPQRHPMLLVDRVTALEAGNRITAVKAVTAGELCYRELAEGLPPERYGYPISLQLESLGQTAALLWFVSGTGNGVGDGDVLLFAAARDCRFTGRAYPGDVLRHEVRLLKMTDGGAVAQGETWVGDHRIAVVGSLVAAIRPASVLPAARTGSTISGQES